jgi:phage tail-like protein
MSVGQRSDPFLDARFLVEIDSLVVAGFSEVSGLEVELETEEYAEGGVNTHTHSLPTRFDYPNLELERGVTDSRALWQWVEDALNGRIERKSGRVILLDSIGQEQWGWEFHEAYPIKWSGPELDADRASVAIEALELTHNGITVMEGLPPR